MNLKEKTAAFALALENRAAKTGKTVKQVMAEIEQWLDNSPKQKCPRCGGEFVIGFSCGYCLQKFTGSKE